MAKTKKAVLTETIIAAAAIVQKRFVNFEGKQATAGQPAVGVSVYDADQGDSLAVDALGIVLVESGGALAAGDVVASDAQGCAVKQAASAITLGRALDAAVGANEVIRIKLGA